ncbi:MAG TPA: hypothetical protein VJJ21_02920 [Candidatus Nanoarchaeia archaeon]|nr:hypothetical protein [Candidatus Nanoarchaeia archaeon]
MVKKRVVNNSRLKHRNILRLTRNSYLLGLIGGVITLLVSLYLLWRLSFAGALNLDLLGASVFMHLLIGLLMILSVFLLRKEHHSFSGSVMLLCTSIIGLNFASGLLIGPLFGIIGGILGLSEHEKMIKKHLE